MAPTALAHNVNGRNVPQPQAREPEGKRSLSPKRPSTKTTSAPPSPAQKKITRRSSKPIINWFQRKLAGTVRGKRVAPLPGSRSPAIPLKPTNRVASSPLPPPSNSAAGKQHTKAGTTTSTKRPSISLNGDNFSFDDDSSVDEGSMALESIGSPTSAHEADDDASLRPIPPSAPPSPSPSRSSSSRLSDPRTFRSIAASTKPTTLLSIDLGGNGMAHIAQAPLTPLSNRVPIHIRTSSNATSITNPGATTFSALPPSPQSSRPPSVQDASQSSPGVGPVQAPLHTAHHPRNNPRPSSPPLDNASVLTLASSAFAMPGFRGGVSTPGWASAPPSALGAGDSFSHFDGSAGYGDAESVDGEEDGERDFDASVRALRPRSSRRGSWESEASRWSARVMGTPVTPGVTRERSLWTTHSVRTGKSADMSGTFDDHAGNGNDPVDGEQAVETLSPTAPSHSDQLIVVTAVQSVPASSELDSTVDVIEEKQVQTIPVGQDSESAGTDVKESPTTTKETS